MRRKVIFRLVGGGIQVEEIISSSSKATATSSKSIP